jgi:hypothetical protein
MSGGPLLGGDSLGRSVRLVSLLALPRLPLLLLALYSVEIGDTAIEYYVDESLTARPLSDAELQAVAEVVRAVADAGPHAPGVMQVLVANSRACSCAPLPGSSCLVIPPGDPRAWTSLHSRGGLQTAKGEHFDTLHTDIGSLPCSAMSFRASARATWSG